jgi:hypothetical protein
MFNWSRAPAIGEKPLCVLARRDFCGSAAEVRIATSRQFVKPLVIEDGYGSIVVVPSIRQQDADTIIQLARRPIVGDAATEGAPPDI